MTVRPDDRMPGDAGHKCQGFAAQAEAPARRLAIWFAAAIPSGSCGGVNRVMVELAAGLRRRGHRVDVIHNDAQGLAGSYLWFAARLGVSLLVNRQRPDWIIARSSDGVGCALLARLLGLTTRVALHNHGWEEHVYEVEKLVTGVAITPATTWRARLIRFPLIRAALCRSHCCISSTLDELRWIGAHYPRQRRKLRYLPNGVDVPAGFTWEQSASPPPHFLCVGGATWKKNTGYAVRLVGRLRAHEPLARLYLVGSEACGENTDGVTCVGFQGMDEMAKWYTACPYLIVPSRFEGGHCLALLEAMAHGMIVFTSSIPSSTEIVTAGRNGFVLSCSDADADAALVMRVIGDAALIRTVRRRARSTAVRNRWARQVLRLERMLT